MNDKDEKIVPIKDHFDVAKGLRNLADEYDNGAYGDSTAAIVIGSHVFALGSKHPDDMTSVKEAVFDLNRGIHVLMEMFDRVGGE
jgi:hypothetical protein